MKLIYAAVLALLFHCTSNATTIPVTVSNFEFSPASVNAVVGDVIQFNWSTGSHTTTCGAGLPGTSLPAGAAEWNSPMTAGNATFSYTLTVEGTYNYGCIPHFAGGMAGTIIVSGPLPVIFGSFSVNNIKSNAVLQWQTFSESNTKYFSVRKSTDGAHFSEIGKVNAAGNSGTSISYQFTDNDLGGIYKFLYYELAIVDVDKKESFSSIKMIRNGSIKKDNIIVTLSPNPITRPGEVQLKFNAEKSGEMQIKVINSAGQEVMRTTMAAFYGLNSGHLHVCDLEKGTYNIVFGLDDKTEIRKVVVL